jgi:y4mF family transcriptional regulator
VVRRLSRFDAFVTDRVRPNLDFVRLRAHLIPKGNILTMTKTLPPSKHSRLTRAIEDARIGSQPSARGMRIIPSVKVGETGKRAQSAVKFPKSSNALRQYVAVAREKMPTTPTVRLRTEPPVSTQTSRLKEAVPRFPTSAKSPAARLRKAQDADTDALMPVRTMAQVGDIVRRSRRRRGLTQADLALDAGTGRRFVSDVEAGKPTIEFESLMKLCKSLGVRLFAIGPDDDE